MPFHRSICGSLVGALAISLLLASGSAAATDTKRIERMFLDEITPKAEPIDVPALEGPIGVPVFKVSFTVLTQSKSNTTLPIVWVYPREDRLVKIYRPNTNRRLEYLEDMIASDFRLNQNSASSLLEAFKVLMHDDDFFEDLGNQKRVVAGDGEWHFLTAEFFDHYSGFRVRVDDSGRIERIDYSMKLRKQ